MGTTRFQRLLTRREKGAASSPLLFLALVAAFALHALEPSKARAAPAQAQQGFFSSLFGATTPSKARKPVPRRTADKPGNHPNPLTGIKAWGYQLRLVVPAEIAASRFDLMVIDYQHTASSTGTFSPDEMAAMRQMPDGRRRVLLAYLSIGEAERYRPYWQQDWYAHAPSWMGAENPEWKGNYPVRFWDPAWRALISGSGDAYLDKIMAAGFDGVYLDRVDVYANWEGENKDARPQMIDFVVGLSAYARAQRPEFLTVAQNAEELIDDTRYLQAIDGLAKEDLLFGMRQSGQPNPQEEVRYGVEKLRRAKRAGKGVFVVEYLCKPEELLRAERRLRLEAGVVPYFGPRTLYRLGLDEGDLCKQPPATGKPASALGKRVALVIGNAQYRTASNLRSPYVDIKDIAAKLRDVGFSEVWERRDLSRDALGHELQRFSETARDADWALVYYTGQGMALGGNNYIIPTDASLDSVETATNEMVPIDQLSDAVAGARQLRLLVLDACHVNPSLERIRGRGVALPLTSGFEPRHASRAVLSLFATRCTETALAANAAAQARLGTQRGIFAGAMISALDTPGLDLPNFLERVRSTVASDSTNAQIPVITGAVPRLPLYFNANAVAPARAVGVTTPKATPASR